MVVEILESISDHARVEALEVEAPRERVGDREPLPRHAVPRRGRRGRRRDDSVEPGDDLPRGLPAVGGTLLQAAHHELVEIGRYLGLRLERGSGSLVRWRAASWMGPGATKRGTPAIIS